MSRNPKRVVVFIALFLFILVLIGITAYKTAHKADEEKLKYLAIKEDYSKNNPDQEMILYPWKPTSPIKILPFNYTVPAIPGNNLSIRACSEEFESASFIISARNDIQEIGIRIPDLHDAQGNTIPADAINIRLVKVWYQAGDDSVKYIKPGSVLTPELLVKDDALIKVDYINRTNFLRVIINGRQQYIDISTPTAIIPANAEIFDAVTLQPFSLKAGENKQIWVTVHILNNTPAGNYYGNFGITSLSAYPVYMNFSVTVLPFDLEPAPLRNIMYYEGKLNTTPINEIGSEWKTTKQYAIELHDMKDHGVLYPTFFQDEDSNLDTALFIRTHTDLPADRIYLGELNARVGNATDAKGLKELATRVKSWRNHTLVYGFGATYFFGMDEVTGKLLLTERDAWETVHANGGKMVATSWDTTDPIELTGNILDAANIGTEINTTAASIMHRYGHEIYLYAQPQVGIENPAIYRKNYGLTLWSSGYDGSMDFAYQWGYGDIWNDFDDTQFRDHVFAYPTSDGVIDTYQWEGFREGIDDTRYVATLIKKGENDKFVKSMISNSLSNGEDPAQIRENIINLTLLSINQ